MSSPGAVLRNLHRMTLQVGVETLRELRSRRLLDPARLTADERSAYEALRADGVVKIPGFMPRDTAIRWRERFLEHILLGQDRDLGNGAYIRSWDERHPKLLEQPTEDRGITRIYHVDRLLPELVGFRDDPFVQRVASAYYRVPMRSGLLQFQHNRQDTSETRYYHVDAFEKEFKAFLYLDDVDESNGPFTYLRGTHRAHGVRLKKQLLGNRQGSQTSFYPPDLGELLNDEVQLSGPAGTLILADVRGFHRGSPQKGASRSVLVNYLYQTRLEG